MDNQKKTNKGLIVLMVVLFALVMMVWGILISAFFISKKDNSSNPTSTAIEYVEEIEDVIDEEQESKLADEEFEKNISLAEEAYTNQNLDSAIKFVNEALNIKNDEIAIELKNKYIEEQNKEKEENNRIKQEQKDNLLENIAKKYDDMNNIYWYTPKGNLEYNVKDGEVFFFYVYMGEKGNKLWLRMTTGFEDSEWTFAKSIIVKADDYRFDIPFDVLKDRKGDVIYRGIREWIDILIDENMVKNLKKVIDSKESKIRFTGEIYYNEYTINSTQKKQLKDIIDYYELVK